MMTTTAIPVTTATIVHTNEESLDLDPGGEKPKDK
jgi:hypothetical protein